MFVTTLAGTITTILDSLGHFVVTGQNKIMSHSYQEKQVLEYQLLQGKNESFGRYLTNFQKKALMKAMQSDIDLEYKKRIQIILMADMGKTQAQICRLVGCSREMARYWANLTKAGLAHKWNEPLAGRPRTANEKYLLRLQELVGRSPRDYGYGFSSWTAQWLSKHLAQEFGFTFSDRHIHRLLKQMGLSTKQKPPLKPQISGGITIRDLQVPESSEHLMVN